MATGIFGSTFGTVDAVDLGDDDCVDDVDDIVEFVTDSDELSVDELELSENVLCVSDAAGDSEHPVRSVKAHNADAMILLIFIKYLRPEFSFR